ncbi:hypothetical protein AMECASPLE_030355 [Ameca splendens]|uniref:Integrase core domain-containing protein n=1 Tax=Ameca splendens TaxID=208324 RepID=A0ABV0Z3W6_9TELE
MRLFHRVERLWHDIWMCVSSDYYETLHSLEEEKLLDPYDTIQMFCAQHVFLPRLQADLNVFKLGWDNHPLRTEQNLSPQQLWTAGLLQKLVVAPEQAEEIQDVDDDITVHEPDMTGIVVPSVECPLSGQNIDRLRATIDVTAPSQSSI